MPASWGVWPLAPEADRPRCCEAAASRCNLNSLDYLQREEQTMVPANLVGLNRGLGPRTPCAAPRETSFSGALYHSARLVAGAGDDSNLELVSRGEFPFRSGHVPSCLRGVGKYPSDFLEEGGSMNVKLASIVALEVAL